MSVATFSPEVASVAGARERLRSAADMDLERREGTAYEYLCHLGEIFDEVSIQLLRLIYPIRGSEAVD